jgi:serine/threonine-protein kinase HipA
MINPEKVIFVYFDSFSETPLPLGRLYANNSRGREIYSFEYSAEWLSSKYNSIMLDPDIGFTRGRQYLTDKPLFGIFADSCPDRWGRLLIKRRETIYAIEHNIPPRSLTEADYLLGVYDETRMGALRFTTEEDGQFLSSDTSLCAPPWTTLRALENASLSFESGKKSDEKKWLEQLLAPGSSLGGARPKASVQAPDGSLWIAKFPSKHDEWNTGAWEMAVHKLAEKCGLNVPDAKLETFSRNGSTFLVKRFDRKGTRRIHYASAMALRGKTDGNSSEATSYLDIASFIKTYGASPKNDLRELWKRIVFNMAVSNTDDHLRNHGFILNETGWVLSPMFDVNPNIYNRSKIIDRK